MAKHYTFARELAAREARPAEGPPPFDPDYKAWKARCDGYGELPLGQKSPDLLKLLADYIAKEQKRLGRGRTAIDCARRNVLNDVARILSTPSPDEARVPDACPSLTTPATHEPAAAEASRASAPPAEGDKMETPKHEPGSIEELLSALDSLYKYSSDEGCPNFECHQFRRPNVARLVVEEWLKVRPVAAPPEGQGEARPAEGPRCINCGGGPTDSMTEMCQPCVDAHNAEAAGQTPPPSLGAAGTAPTAPQGLPVDHRCPEIGRDTLQGAFVSGAKWWEFASTGGTMWASDRDKAWAEAEKRYPLPAPPAGASTTTNDED